jgi:hypothetical protein
MNKLNEATDVLDSTKLKDWQTCDRLFFYKHIYGWEPDTPSIDLKFGEAMHDAWAVLEKHGTMEEFLPLAFIEFMNTFRQYFSATDDERFPAKNPAKASEALQGYVSQWKDTDADFQPLYVEVAGNVPISNERRIHFKCDAILKHVKTGMIRIREKKTASQDSRAYHQQWDMSTQLGTYTHVGHCLFDPNEFEGVEMDTTFFYKASKAKFDRRKAYRSKDKMEEWLWHTNRMFDEIKAASEDLLRALDHDPLVMSDLIFKFFPQRTESCTKYYGCRYLPFCTSWTNPLSWVFDVPMDFKQEWWDPRTVKSQQKIEL